MISLVNALAKHYGWGEKYIVWELPYWRALLYYHAILFSEGVWTIEPPKVSRESLDLSWLLGQSDAGDENDWLIW